MNTILIVGFGSIGKRVIGNILANHNAKIVICTKRKDLAKLEKKGIIIVDSVSKALLHKPNIAFITNETSHHIQTALKLANYGLDIFIEKPLSNSMHELRNLRKLLIRKS